MAEYIEREAIKYEQWPVGPLYEPIMVVRKKTIDNIPAADVAPVRHGLWVRIGIKGRKGLPIYPCCSVCGIVSAAFRSEWEGLRGPWKFCPNCGCRMDLEG